MISSYLVVCKQFVVKLVILSMVISLAACGGGGDDDKPRPTPTPTPTPDTTPADFSLSLPQSTYAPGAVATTAEVTITDIDQLVNISITTGGEYAVDGGSFTSSAGQIAENQTLVARATAGANFDDEVMISVTVGTVTESFTVVTEAQDTTPDAFSFTAVTDAALSSEFVSEAVTITGINDAAPVSITGGEYAIDAGTYTNSAGSVTNGQSITVRLMSSSAFSTLSAATLNVGGVEAGFSVTTLAQDIEPDAFSFMPETDADISTAYTSETITVSGINDTTAISIANGEYAVNGGDYTAEAATVINGDTVSVRITSATTPSTLATTTLTIGGVEGSYSVTTLADTTAPTAEIAFPPPVSKTENPSVIVRGSAADDLSSVSSVQIFVNGADSGVTVTTENNYATWSVQLPLVEGDNAIAIVVSDTAGNTDIQAASVSVLRDDFANAFPHDGVSTGTTTSMIVENTTGSYRLVNADLNVDYRLVFTDLATGVRTEAFINTLSQALNRPGFLALDEDTGTLYVLSHYSSEENGISAVDFETFTLIDSYTFDSALGAYMGGMFLDKTTQTEPRLLVSFPLDNTVRSIDLGLTDLVPFSSNALQDLSVLYAGPWGAQILPGTNRIFVSNTDNGQFIEVDADTGQRSLFADAALAEGSANTWVSSDAIAFDVYGGRNRILAVDTVETTLLAVDLDTAEVTRFSEPGLNPFLGVWDIVIHPDFDFAFVLDTAGEAIFAIDLESGQRVVITKN